MFCPAVCACIPTGIMSQGRSGQFVYSSYEKQKYIENTVCRKGGVQDTVNIYTDLFDISRPFVNIHSYFCILV